MKVTRRNLRRLILKEFKINKDYASMFDLSDLQSDGGDVLPPIEPPDKGGGGGGSNRSEFPLMLVGIFIKGRKFGATTMGSDDAYIDFPDSAITISANVENGTVDCLFSFYDRSLGYTDIIDMISLKCRSEEDVRRVYIALHNFLVATSIADVSGLNSELSKLGSNFFDRYLKEDFLNEYKYIPPDNS